MEHENLLEVSDNILQDEHGNSPTFLYNKETVSRGLLWDDDGDAVKNAKSTFILVIIFFIGLYLVYILCAFLERCRHKIGQPLIPWRLLPGIPSVSSTSPETQVESVEPNAALRGRMDGDGGSVAEFVFPPVHLAKAHGLLHLQPSPMHLPPDKRNPDAEEIIVFLPLFPISPPSSSLDLSNPEGDRDVSLNVTNGSDKNTL